MITEIVGGALRHRRATLAIWLVFVLAAALFAIRLPLDALPDITNNQVQVLTRAPGLSPEEVELRVTRPIEAAIASIPGVETHRSISRYGLSAVTIVFADAVPLLRARQLVSERITTVEMPEGAEAPELGPMTGGLGEVLQFAVHSSAQDDATLLRLVEMRIAPLLRAVPGIVEVNAWGGAQRQYDINVNPQAASQFGLSLRMIADAIHDATGRVPGAALPIGDRQVLLRGSSAPTSIEELEQIVIASQGQAPNARLVRLREVARVVPSQRARIGAATMDGKGETVYVMAQMLLGENAKDVATRARTALAHAEALLPRDVHIEVIYNRATLIDKTLRTLRNNLAEGGALVIAILLLTLGRLRAGLIVAFAIPVAMLGATAVMAFFNMPGNLMSLGAIDFGLIVDGAVVMIDAVFHHAQAHPENDTPWPQQTRAASLAVARPIFFSGIITALVYVPILAMQGTDGKLFRPMAITVVLALSIALAFALTAAPVLAATWLSPARIPKQPPYIMRAFDRGYSWVLARLPRLRGLVAGIAIASLIVAGVLFARAGQDLTPTLDEGDLVIQTTRAPDINLDAAIERATAMEAAIREHVPEVQRIASRIGSPAVATDVMGLEQADVFVGLKPSRQWRPGLDKNAVIAEIERVIAEHAPGSDPAFTQPIQMRFNELLGGASSDVVISIFGDDLGELDRIGAAYEQALGKVASVSDVRVLVPPRVMLQEVVPRHADVAIYQSSPQAILDTVTALRYGLGAGTTYDGPWPVPLVVKLHAAATPDTLAATPTLSSAGKLLPLSLLADIRSSETPSAILHDRGQRRIALGFNVRGASLGDAVGAARKAVASIALPQGYRSVWGGQFETLAQARARLLLIAPLVLALILGMLWLAFRSMRHCLIVITHVPFAAVGGVITLALRGMSLSISAYIGFIALAGIAVMNGVVLLSVAREHEAAGRPPAEAIAAAAASRARPVLVTATVAALGFVPMMLATGVGAEIQRPLATVIVGGLVSSTALTLFILPAIYTWLRGKNA